MKIAIIGTRGIPNHHGGFEQFTEYFSVFLVSRGHEVFVYNSHNHPYSKTIYKEVHIIHTYDPEKIIGTAGQFIYDLNCILDARKRKYDLILQLGYTSNSIWYWLLPKQPIIVTNMDGLEWKRSKYGPIVRYFLRLAEKLAVKSSDFLISDSTGIQRYIKMKYQKSSEFIAYGANIVQKFDSSIVKEYGLKKEQYCLIIARMEPENNIEIIVDGFSKSNVDYRLVIIGKLNKFGNRLRSKYAHDNRINFMGADYNQDNLNNLRHYSRYYFHGHSVGGTNPSLLEAMSSGSLIIANDNDFNKSVLRENALYFKFSSDVTKILQEDSFFKRRTEMVAKTNKTITEYYSWNYINQSYENYLKACLEKK